MGLETENVHSLLMSDHLKREWISPVIISRVQVCLGMLCGSLQ